MIYRFVALVTGTLAGSLLGMMVYLNGYPAANQADRERALWIAVGYCGVGSLGSTLVLSGVAGLLDRRSRGSKNDQIRAFLEDHKAKLVNPEDIAVVDLVLEDLKDG